MVKKIMSQKLATPAPAPDRVGNKKQISPPAPRFYLWDYCSNGWQVIGTPWNGYASIEELKKDNSSYECGIESGRPMAIVKTSEIVEQINF